jgi:hypothetical protein
VHKILPETKILPEKLDRFEQASQKGRMGTARLARIISEIMTGTGPVEHGAG